MSASIWRRFCGKPATFCSSASTFCFSSLCFFFAFSVRACAAATAFFRSFSAFSSAFCSSRS